ncbi:hypothetical protein [Deinococcus ruber]|uniref:Uncharacterized protein n=1 Tax=Deinococcus ruber TaxID=1848197 RepID=A0A918CCP8_9DEIO|nr:hypothetical protein [Deinococcus ruber]GGR17137.1 hypothetical protein GCM10008957_32170 [Deinococcus ruber]
MPDINTTQPQATLTVHLSPANNAYVILFRGTLMRVKDEPMFFGTRADAQKVIDRLDRMKQAEQT